MAGKTNFDMVVNENLNKVSKIEETKQIITQFKNFLELKIPKEVGCYEWKDREILLKVFKYVPTDDSSIIINTSGDTNNVNKIRYFSIGVVWAAGEASKFKEGDIVKLRDTDVLSIESTKYKEWIDNPLSKSNMKQKGEEPQRYVSNVYKTLGPYAFILNPFDLENLDSHIDDGVYKVNDNLIENRIKNVDILYNSL